MFKAIRGIFRAIRQNFRSILAIGISIALGPAGLAWNPLIVGFISGVVSGGDLKSGVIGAITAGAFSAVGTLIPKYGLSKIVAHGLVGGVSSLAQGGSFQSGFLSAGFTQAIAPAIDGINPNHRGPNLGRTIAAAVAGGAASVLGGGKFANGAITGAFSRLFNDDAHQRRAERQAQLAAEFKKSIGDSYVLGVFARFGTVFEFIDRVRSRGFYDYKSRPEYRDLPDIEAFGNFAFGATTAAYADGASGGISNLFPSLTTNLILRGAGYYQENYQKYNPSDGHFYDNAPPAVSNYADQFRDSVHITQGTQYYFRNR